MRLSYIAILLLFVQGAAAQKITYFKAGNDNYKRYRLDVIAKHDNKILVYKGAWSGLFFEAAPPSMAIPGSVTDLTRSGAIGRPSLRSDSYILKSSLYILDSNMNLLEEKTLPLPSRITGVHFLVYDDFFYLFYQYLQGHTVYCMAVKVGMDGRLIGDPVEMDKIYNLDGHYQSQIYSVIHSENKKYIIAFNEDDRNSNGNTINTLFFDQDLHLLYKSSHVFSMAGSEYLSEFQADNAGNLVFLGFSTSSEKNNAHKAILFTLPPGKDSLSYHYVVPADLYADDIRLLIDNTRKRYILTSFYSSKPQGDIEGIYCLIRDAEKKREDITMRTFLSDSLLQTIKTSAPLKNGFNDYYLQQMHLLGDGSIEIDAANLTYSPIQQLYNRWNYLPYFPAYIASHYLFYDPYEYDHYYPWKTWEYLGRRFVYNSTRVLSISCDLTGRVKWINVLNTPQLDQLHYTLGYKSFAANGLLYFLYNVRIHHTTFLTAQSIDANGELNTDKRLKEDLVLEQSDMNYVYFPRRSKLVDAGELILPCIRGEIIYLAKIGF